MEYLDSGTARITREPEDSHLGGGGLVESPPQQNQKYGTQQSQQQQRQRAEADRRRRAEADRRYQQSVRNQEIRDLVQQAQANLIGNWILFNKKNAWDIMANGSNGIRGISLDSNTQFNCQLKANNTSDVVCEGKYIFNSKEAGTVTLRSGLDGYAVNGSTKAYSSGISTPFSWGRRRD